jgi:hypothetical protein
MLGHCLHEIERRRSMGVLHPLHGSIKECFNRDVHNLTGTEVLVILLVVVVHYGVGSLFAGFRDDLLGSDGSVGEVDSDFRLCVCSLVCDQTSYAESDIPAPLASSRLSSLLRR